MTESHLADVIANCRQMLASRGQGAPALDYDLIGAVVELADRQMVRAAECPDPIVAMKAHQAGEDAYLCECGMGAMDVQDGDLLGWEPPEHGLVCPGSVGCGAWLPAEHVWVRAYKVKP